MKGFDRARSEAAYKSSRITLLTLIILTVANVLFYFLSFDFEMLFCIDFPYVAAVIADTAGNTPLGIAICAAVLLFFLSAWHFSAKNHGWLVAAAVAHVLDTATLFYLASFDGIGEFIFPLIIHVVASAYLVSGCVHGAKLKKNAAADPAIAAQFGARQAGQFGPQQNVYSQPQQGQFYQPYQPQGQYYQPQQPYQQPEQTYQPHAQPYQQPEQTYQPQAQPYQQPEQTYQPQAQPYKQPEQTYQPQAQPYKQPDQQYQPPREGN